MISNTVLLFCLSALSLLSVSLADSICTRDGQYKTYYPGDCTKYYQCNNGKATEETCDSWVFTRYFDEASHQCVHWWLVNSIDCRKALNPAPPTTLAPPPNTASTSATTKMTASTPTQHTGTSSTTTKPSSKPNSVTTKKSSGVTVEISMLLATLCTLISIFKNIH